MPRKTYNEKLHSPGELPKIEDLSAKPEAVSRYGGTQLLVATPMQYNDIMACVPEGRVITAEVAYMGGEYLTFTKGRWR